MFSMRYNDGRMVHLESKDAFDCTFEAVGKMEGDYAGIWSDDEKLLFVLVRPIVNALPMVLTVSKLRDGRHYVSGTID